MIPVSLTLEGLYSYQKAQTIDFKSLTSNQLFGIFGEVGSGKSSILEAIMFVLYGESDRLNKSGDNRYYNMLNLRANRLYIDFICLAGNRNQEEYRFTFEAKRKRDYEKVEAIQNGRRVYKKVAGQWAAQEDLKPEEILGMNYKNFKTTTIIPQGKFREFIEQTASNRTTMLQELFQLDQFDLSQRTNTLYTQNHESFSQAQGKMSGLEEFTAELLLTTEQDAKTCQEQLQTVQQSLTEKEEALKEQQQLQTLSGKLISAEQEEKWLRQEDAPMAEKEIRLRKYQKAYQQFHDRILRHHELLQQEKEIEKRVQHKEAELQQTQAQLKHAQLQKDSWQEKYNQRDQDLIKVQELTTAIEISDLSGQLKKAELTTTKAQADHVVAEQLAETSRQTLREAEERLQEVKRSAKDISLLHEIHQWFEQERQLANELKNTDIRLKKQQAELAQFERQKADFLPQAGLEHTSTSLSFADALQALQAKNEIQKARQKLINEQINELKVKKEVAGITLNLVHGEPCPVCGATHHPNRGMTDHAQLETELTALLNTSQQLEKDIALQESQYQKLQQLALSFGHLRAQFEEADFELEQKQQALLSFQKSFFWQDFTLNDAEKVKNSIQQEKQRQNQAQKLEEQISQLRKIADGHLAEKDQLLKAVNEHQTRKATLLAQVTDRIKTIKLLPYQNLQKFSRQQLEESLGKGKQQLHELDLNYPKAMQAFQQLSVRSGQVGAELAAAQQELVKNARQANLLQLEIDQQLANSDFADLEAVKSVLRWRLKVEEEQKEIDQFKAQKAANQATLHTLRGQLGGKVFSAEELSSLKKEVDNLQKQRNALTQQMGELNGKIKDVKQKLKEKAVLQRELQAFADREENLKTMQNLFRGRGFVEFVSTVYLHNLVKAANKRFMRLTRNSLGLELNETNDFIVRDYLSEGKTRLLKTLSGGQTFQAALCLALALAENVKSLNQAEQSFFFLDEGFGTLDRNSLQTVFETLKALRQENRIVGVISHVEELQQEIEVFLHIENDKELGSLVKASW